MLQTLGSLERDLTMRDSLWSFCMGCPDRKLSSQRDPWPTWGYMDVSEVSRARLGRPERQLDKGFGGVIWVSGGYMNATEGSRALVECMVRNSDVTEAFKYHTGHPCTSGHLCDVPVPLLPLLHPSKPFGPDTPIKPN
jgi:hypothetical protein